MTVAYTQPQSHLQYCAQTVAELRARLKLTPMEMAQRLETDVPKVKDWENAKLWPNNRAFDCMHHIAHKRGWLDLVQRVKVARDDWHREKVRGQKPRPIMDNTAKHAGRETTLIQVIGLIDERATEIRNHQTMYDELAAKGMSISDIVAHELDLIKADLRALPVQIPSVIQSKPSSFLARTAVK